MRPAFSLPAPRDRDGLNRAIIQKKTPFSKSGPHILLVFPVICWYNSKADIIFKRSLL